MRAAARMTGDPTHVRSCQADEFCRDREFSIVTEIVRPRVAIEISCRDRAWGWGGRGARRQRTLDARQSLISRTQRARQPTQCVLSYASDRLDVHYVVHCLGVLFMGIIHEHCSWGTVKKKAPRKLGRHKLNVSCNELVYSNLI